jgi:hypothetical protein
MTVSQPNTVPETEETDVYDRILALAEEDHLGWEDIAVRLRAEGIKCDQRLLKTIVLKRTTAPESDKGQLTGSR